MHFCFIVSFSLIRRFNHVLTAVIGNKRKLRIIFGILGENQLIDRKDISVLQVKVVLFVFSCHLIQKCKCRWRLVLWIVKHAPCLAIDRDLDLSRHGKNAPITGKWFGNADGFRYLSNIAKRLTASEYISGVFSDINILILCKTKFQIC